MLMLAALRLVPDASDPEADVALARAASTSGANAREARRQLVERLVDRVRTSVFYLVSADCFDDVVQESLLAILDGLGGFRGEARLETWADRITVRTALRVQKEVRRRGHACSDSAVETLAGGSHDDPEHQLDARALREDLALRLQSLPSAQRQALVLHWV